MQIFVRVALGRTITVDVEANESVESVKEKIWAREGVPIAMQRLFYGGKFLTKGILSDFGVENEVTLNLNYASSPKKIEHIERKYVTDLSYEDSAPKRRCVQI